MSATTMKTKPDEDTVSDDEDVALETTDDATELPDDGAVVGSETANPSRRLRRLLAAGAVVVVAGAVGAAGFFGWKTWETTKLADATQQARSAAESYAQVLTSIDSDKVDENFQQVLDGSTGEFKDMYSQSSVQLRQLLIDNKAAAHGVVVDSAVQSATPTEAVILLFVDQSVSNASLPDPRIDRSRIKMTMEYVDGRWRASKVELP